MEVNESTTPSTLVRVSGDVLLVEHHGEMANASGLRRALYDARAMLAPPAALTLMQQDLDDQLGGMKLRRAIVVPGTKIAYLARIAFGEGDARVFYDDIDAALAWLRSA
jgi:hypothetical protein